MNASLFTPGLLVGAVAAITVGCATATKAPQTAVDYTPRFDYTPPQNAEPRSLDVTLALVNANYSEEEWFTTYGSFRRFSTSLSKDFEEALIAKGFTVRGPYDRYDMMTYPDREASDLVLIPKIDISLEVRVTETVSKKDFLGLTPTKFQFRGTAEMHGRVTLKVSESLSNEGMWLKTIELQPRAVAWESAQEYPSPEQSQIYMSRDRGLMTPLGKALEGYYDEIMETVWRYLDPDEMQLVKRQAIAVRDKWAP